MFQQISRFFWTLVVGSSIFLPAVWGQGALDQLEQELNAPRVPINPPSNAGEIPPPLPDPASEPGYLGMVVDEPRPGDAGPSVVTVRDGSPAQLAGIRQGDLVLSIDGLAIRSLNDLDRALSRATAGQTLRIVLNRGGEEITLAPQLVARNAVPPAAPRDPNVMEIGPEPQPVGRASLGISVGQITEQAQRQYNLPVPRGALITAVNPGSAADQAGLPLGGAIVAVDGRVVETSQELTDLIRTFRPGQEIELTYYQGDRLNRKNVRLGQAASSVLVPRNPQPAPYMENGNGPTNGSGDRPLLRKLEQVLGGNAGGLVPPGLIPGGILPGGNQSGGAVPRPGDLPSTIARPDAAGGAYPSLVPAAVSGTDMASQVAELQTQVRTLQVQMERLEKLLKSVEERLPQAP